VAHRYGAPVAVDVRPDGTPAAFTWRGEHYKVRVIGRWALATNWWLGPAGRVERTYYRCQAPDQQVFELYQDTVHGGWVLDCLLD
jgi:hypothetical protein